MVASTRLSIHAVAHKNVAKIKTTLKQRFYETRKTFIKFITTMTPNINPTKSIPVISVDILVTELTENCNRRLHWSGA